MEVLKHGQEYEKDLKARTVKCKCGCDYRFEVSDIELVTKIYNDDPLYPSGRMIKEHVVYCPECGKTKNVNDYCISITRKK